MPNIPAGTSQPGWLHYITAFALLIAICVTTHR